MESLIATFHIDWKLMIAQFVNFVIVFFVLYRFALKPLMKTMAERSATIAKSLEQAKKIEDDIAATAETTKAAIKDAKQQSAEIITAARHEAEGRKEVIIKEAEQKVAHVVAQAKVQIEAEKQAMLEAVRAEAAQLVVTATEKILHHKLDETSDKKYINEMIKKL
jgi:F-type H+-transporting ATPase subunit b